MTVVSTGTVRTDPPPVRLAARQGVPLSRGLAYLAVAYAALSTLDVKLGSVPVKLFVVLPALVLWWREAGEPGTSETLRSAGRF